jgi:hypothetical protein
MDVKKFVLCPVSSGFSVGVFLVTFVEEKASGLPFE